MSNQNGELELELEQEFHEGEFENESEGEGWLGAVGNAVGSLLGEQEGEDEFEEEFEDESENEFEGEGESEGWLSGIGNAVGGLLGEQESEDEFENEYETENFSFGGLFKKIAPILKKVAKVAAPLVGGALLGPAGAALGNMAGSALGEGEFEDEFESEMEDEYEGEAEMVHEILSHPLTHNEAMAEMFAEAASKEPHGVAAEAMAAAAVVTVLSPRDRRALGRILPHLIRATAVLTRILRKRRDTRIAVRAVPSIMRRSVKDLKRHAAKGKPVTRRRAARAVAKQVRRVLSSPKASTAAVKRNVRAARLYKRPHRPRRRMRTSM